MGDGVQRERVDAEGGFSERELMSEFRKVAMMPTASGELLQKGKKAKISKEE